MEFSPARLAIVRSPSAREVSDASKLGDDTRFSLSRPSTSPAVGSATYEAARQHSIAHTSMQRAASPAGDAAFDAAQRSTPWLQLPDSPGFYDVQPEWLTAHSHAFGQVHGYITVSYLSLCGRA